MATMLSLEDHFVSSAMEQPNPAVWYFDYFGADLGDRLRDVGPVRLRAMDDGNVALQIVSAAPMDMPLFICQQTNDQLADDVAKAHGRLAGFAALPMSDPQAAAAELERCVKTLKFLGALIPNHASGTYYDGPQYRTFWKAAETLDVPVYMHPTAPTPLQQESFVGNYSKRREATMSEWAWGWHTDVGLHFLKLYSSGLFDPSSCPHLKLILGHAGELVPFMLARSGRFFNIVCTDDNVERDVLDVWKENVWVTLSGMWDLAPLTCLLKTTSVDRVMYSLDYPFEDPVEGRKFMEEVRQSGIVTAEDYDKIAFGNAEGLLKIIRRPSVD